MLWICNELIANARPLPLTPRYRLENKSTNLAVSTSLELKPFNHALGLVLYLGVVEARSQLRSKAEAFEWYHGFNQDVILHHKSANVTKLVFFESFSIALNASF